MSVGLTGLLQTAFELKLDLPASNVTPDAATLTLYALNQLKNTNHQNPCSIPFLFLFFNKMCIFLFELRATQPN